MIGRKDIPNFIKRSWLLLAVFQILLGVIRLCAELKENPVCILTVVVALFSYRYFLKQFMGEWFLHQKETILSVWSAYIVTFPVILHGHFSEWRYSLATSFVVCILANLKRMKRAEENKSRLIIAIGIGGFGAGVLVPAYGVIIGIVVLLSFLVACGKKRISMGIILLTFAIVVSGLAVGYYVDFESEGKPRIQNSLSSVLLSRFAWPYFVRNSYFWEPEVREIFSDSDLAYISNYPELVKYDFGPKLEAYVGKARAREIYRKMAWDSFQIGKKEAFGGLGRDLLANAAGPFAVQYQLSGRGISYTGTNYADLRSNMPGLTKYYVKFSMYSFDFMVLLSAMIAVWAGVRKKVCLISRRNLALFSLLAMLIFWYSMVGNGMQDYLKVMPVHVIWCLLPALGYGLLRVENEQQDEVEKG